MRATVSGDHPHTTGHATPHPRLATSPQLVPLSCPQVRHTKSTTITTNDNRAGVNGRRGIRGRSVRPVMQHAFFGIVRRRSIRAYFPAVETLA